MQYTSLYTNFLKLPCLKLIDAVGNLLSRKFLEGQFNLKNEKYQQVGQNKQLICKCPIIFYFPNYLLIQRCCK